MAYQVRFEHDEYPDLSWLDQWNTPAKYKGNEILDNGKQVCFKRYMQYWGNPDRHVTLCMIVRHVRDDGYEKIIDTLGGIDFMDDQRFATGDFWFESANEVQDSTELNDYQKELVRNAIDAAVL